MAYTCEFCGKRRQKAHKVSHSNIKTRKWQQPNLQSVRAVVGGRTKRVRACTRCIRTGKVIEWACWPPGVVNAINLVRKEKPLRTFPVTVEGGQVFVEV